MLLVVFGALTMFGKIYIKYNHKIFIKLFVLFTFIRLAVPFMEIANAYIYETIMKKELSIIHIKMKNMEKVITNLLPTKDENKIEQIKKEIEKLKIEKENVILKNSDGFINKQKASLFNIYNNFSSAAKLKINNSNKNIKLKEKELENLDISMKIKFEIAIKKIDTLSDIYLEEAYNAIFMFLLRAIFFPLIFLYFFAKILKIIFDDE
jgi:hypothetical protein